MRALLVVAGVLSVSCGVGACTGWYDDEAQLGHYSEEMKQSLHDVRVAVALHHDQVLDAGSPSAIDDLEQTHIDQTNRRLDGAQMAQDDIAKCSVDHFSGERGADWQAIYEAEDVAGMSALDFHLEMLRHARAMGATRDLAHMLDEERVHQTSMADLIATLEDQSERVAEQLQSLDKGGESMTCSRRTHMH